MERIDDLCDRRCCITCQAKKFCIGSPVRTYPTMYYRPYFPWWGPNKDKCMSYVKEEKKEECQNSVKRMVLSVSFVVLVSVVSLMISISPSLYQKKPAGSVEKIKKEIGLNSVVKRTQIPGGQLNKIGW